MVRLRYMEPILDRRLGRRFRVQGVGLIKLNLDYGTLNLLR